MEIQENNYEDMKNIVLYQNKLLLRKICRKFNWDYKKCERELFSK